MLFMAMLLVVALPGAAMADRSTTATGDVGRVSGDTRVNTSVELSQETYPNGASTALLATARGFPDALAGATLAGQLNAPLLLSEPTETSATVKNELARLGVTELLVLGGDAALPGDVVEGYDVPFRRLAGADRYETAVRIASQLDGTPDRVFLATGENFPDAVSVSAWAAATGTPIVLTASESLPSSVSAYLAEMGSPTVVPIGGQVAISTAVLETIEDQGHDVTGRVAGATRYATSYGVAARHHDEVGGASTLWVATGAAYPDALAAGPAVAARGGVFALTDPQTTDSDGTADVRGLVENLRACDGSGGLEEGVVVGGTGAVAGSVVDQLRALLACEPFPECLPAYPTLCLQPPPPNVTCDDVGEQSFPVDRSHDDVHGLDANGNGVGCEPDERDGGGGGDNCHPSYPDVCIPPPPPDLNCGDVEYRNFRVDHTHGDPHNFDGNKDGIACTS